MKCWNKMKQIKIRIAISYTYCADEFADELLLHAGKVSRIYIVYFFSIRTRIELKSQQTRRIDECLKTNFTHKIWSFSKIEFSTKAP